MVMNIGKGALDLGESSQVFIVRAGLSPARTINTCELSEEKMKELGIRHTLIIDIFILFLYSS
jgi:hypothetical protein